MARERTTPWTTKPGGPEFRLERVDGRATVDVGLSKRFGQRLGPGFRSEKWGGRGWLEIRGHGVELNRPGEIKSHPKYGDVYECECTRMARGRRRGERHLIVPGSVEYQIEWDTLADVPEDGYIDFLLEFSGDLAWHKQPALTQAEIDQGVSQPENVVNSYAVYGLQSGRFLKRDGAEIVNYETGKFCHVYRPRLIDANGNTLWCDQTAPLAGPNRLRVYLDREWLSGATFPVTLDPTFGYTSIGAIEANVYGYRFCHVASARLYTATAGDTITKYSVYSSGLKSSVAAYTVVSGSPSARLHAADAVDQGGSGYGWKETATLSHAMSAATYGIAVTNNTSHAFQMDNIGSTQCVYAAEYGLPDPWTGSSTYNYVFSWYATYTVASGHPASKRFGGVPFAAVNRGVW